jgi:hypothetical protein
MANLFGKIATRVVGTVGGAFLGNPVAGYQAAASLDPLLFPDTKKYFSQETRSPYSVLDSYLPTAQRANITRTGYMDLSAKDKHQNSIMGMTDTLVGVGGTLSSMLGKGDKKDTTTDTTKDNSSKQFKIQGVDPYAVKNKVPSTLPATSLSTSSLFGSGMPMINTIQNQNTQSLFNTSELFSGTMAKNYDMFNQNYWNKIINFKPY